jgi:hypothetical protein
MSGLGVPTPAELVKAVGPGVVSRRAGSARLPAIFDLALMQPLSEAPAKHTIIRVRSIVGLVGSPTTLRRLWLRIRVGFVQRIPALKRVMTAAECPARR